jgi:hypothetical protein
MCCGIRHPSSQPYPSTKRGVGDGGDLAPRGPLCEEDADAADDCEVVAEVVYAGAGGVKRQAEERAAAELGGVGGADDAQDVHAEEEALGEESLDGRERLGNVLGERRVHELPQAVAHGDLLLPQQILLAVYGEVYLLPRLAHALNIVIRMCQSVGMEQG